MDHGLQDYGEAGSSPSHDWLVSAVSLEVIYSRRASRVLLW